MLHNNHTPFVYKIVNNNMNYQKIYNDMITACKTTKFTCYTEIHHIIPLSIGGSDSKENLVELSARHHYIAHLLLTKIYENEPIKYRSLLYAVMCMRYGRVNNERSFKYNSHLYAIKKEKFAKMRSEQMKTDNPTLGKVFIMDIKNEVNMCINKSDPLPNGFVYGKCMNFKSLKDKIQENDLTIDEFIQMKIEKRNKFIRFKNGSAKQHHEKYSLEQQVEKLKRIKDEEIRIAERDKQLKNMYHDYLSFGFKYVCEKYYYTKSRENLIIAFKRHVPEYDKNSLLKISVKLKKENDGYKQSSNNKKLSKEEKIQMFTEMYEDFKLNGFDFVVEKYDWKSSRNALVMNFKNYVANYIPTPTSRWNKNT